MKKDFGQQWKTGLFIVTGFTLLLVTLFILGKQKNIFTAVFRLHTVFNNVSGLSIGSNIRYGGLTVGTVENIQLLNDTTVAVDLLLQQTVKKFIKLNATVTIGSDGLMGEKVLVISPGIYSNQEVKDGDRLASAVPVTMDGILSSLKTSADHAAILTDQLAQLSYKINHGRGMLSKMIGDTVFASNISATMVNLKQSSVGLKENMEAAKSNFLLRGYFRKKKKALDKKEKANKELESQKNKEKQSN